MLYLLHGIYIIYVHGRMSYDLLSQKYCVLEPASRQCYGACPTGTIQATEKAEREKVPFDPATTSDNATTNKSIKKA